MWETLPNWFWNIYYLFLLTTLGAAIYSLKMYKNKILSILAIVFIILIPIVSILNSIGRAPGIDEYEHLISQLQLGATWSIFTIIAYMFLLVWWVLFFLKIKSKNKATISN
ncbi:hypothetical protein DZB84_21005 [Bacillus sp. HNG]|uniref:hypothetical protein n=1 Tax=Bacillus sp. HNG TaxID=2293325 RepID=UPI000E2E8942|nr:hypothetical protein [Bacillus sp. HNG]RFB11411.1 hypothetical protein DZB84_21005 [Bacillus sp. HNG]